MMEESAERQQEVPLHVQQAQQIAARMQQDKASSDSVTWVPELIPQFVQRAVEAVLASTQDAGSGSADDSDIAAATDGGSTGAGSSTPTPTAPAPVLALSSQHLRVTSSSSTKRPVDWVMTTCLVPEGLPIAAAAEEAGGLATMEVVCRLLMLQDCQTVKVSAAFTKAVTKVKWQQYGLQYKDFFSCDDNTGILTLGVLPESTMVPLSLIVCSCNTIQAPQGMLDPEPPDTDAAAAAADQAGSDPTTQAQTQAAGPTPGSKRRRGGASRGPRKPPSLSARRELPLWVSAVEGALAALKAQLPVGYMHGRHETLLAGALPPIAASLASIMARAANTQLREESFDLLDCEPAELEEALLAQLQELAAEALTLKMSTAAAATQQQGITQQPPDAPAAAAALLAAGDGDAEGEQQEGEEEEEQQHEEEEGQEADHHHGYHQQQQQQQDQEQPPWADAHSAYHQHQQQQQPPRLLTADGSFTGVYGTQQQRQQQQQQQQQGLSRFGGAAGWEGQQQVQQHFEAGQQPPQQQQQQQQWRQPEEGLQMHSLVPAWQANHTGSQQWQQQQQHQEHNRPWQLLGPASWQQDCNTQRDATQHVCGSTAAAAAAAGGGGGGGNLRGGSNLAGAWRGNNTPVVPAGRRRVSGSAAAGLF